MSGIRIGGETTTWLSIGWIIALVVLIAAVILVFIGLLNLVEGILIGALALSRLV